MKKIVSWILFILIVIIVVFDIYAAIVGAIDIKNQFDELVARGASGHEFLGVGLDVRMRRVGEMGVPYCAISISAGRNMR